MSSRNQAICLLMICLTVSIKARPLNSDPQAEPSPSPKEILAIAKACEKALNPEKRHSFEPATIAGDALQAFVDADRKALIHTVSSLIQNHQHHRLLPACQEPLLWAFAQSAVELRWPLPTNVVLKPKAHQWQPPALPLLLEGLKHQILAIQKQLGTLPNEPGFHSLLARGLQAGHGKAAIQAYTAALSAALSVYQRRLALQYRATEHLYLQKWREALSDLEAALEILPSPWLYENAVRAAANLGKYRTALEYQDALQAENPNAPPAKLPTPDVVPIKKPRAYVQLQSKLQKLLQAAQKPPLKAEPPPTPSTYKILLQRLRKEDLAGVNALTDRTAALPIPEEMSQRIGQLMHAPLKASRVEHRIRLWLQATPLLSESLKDRLRIRLLVWFALLGEHPAALDPWEVRQLEQLAEDSWLKEALQKEN